MPTITNITRSSTSRTFSRRLLSTSSILQSKAKCKSSDEIDLKSALDLLSTDSRSPLLAKLSTPDMTETEKQKYINYFTKVLNTDIKQTVKNDKNYNEHFTQSLMGLNQLLSTPNSSKITSQRAHDSKLIFNLDTISLKDAITTPSFSKHELIAKFDNLINTDKLSLKTFSVILSKVGNEYDTLNYILTKMNFMNRDHRYDHYKLLICSKAMQSFVKTKDPKLIALVQELNEKDSNTWIRLRNENKLNKVLEKSLYQILFKLSKQQLLSLSFTATRFTLLIESLPSQLSLLTEIYDAAEASDLPSKLSSNQMALYEFVTFLSSNREILNKTQFMTLQRKLIKLSVDNNVHKESQVTEGDSLTVHKYRFRNGLGEILESLEELDLFDSQVDLVGLRNVLKTGSEIVYKETVLKFI